jgi:multidrug efflux pump subunit AcrB
VRAAREGTREITFAALAATIAVVAIFIPVVFMQGIMGKFFLQFGVTLCVAVLLSYLEAITLAPARCAQMLKTSRHGRSWLGRLVDRGFDRLGRGYGWLLGHGLKYPGVVLILAGGLVVGAYFAFSEMPGEFVPSQDQSRLMVRLQTAVGSNLEETDRLFKKAEAIVNGKKEVDRAMVIVGGFGGSGVNTGVIFMNLVPPDQRAPQAEVAAALRRELNAIPGLRAVVQDLSQAGFTAQRGFPVEFSIRGPDWDELVEISGDMREKLIASGLVVDVDTDYQLGMPELQIKPDRARAADLGISVGSIAQTINAMVGGVRVGKYSTGGRRVDVRLRLLAQQRSRPEDISRLRVRAPATAELLPLSTLVTQEEKPALQAITRRDRERAITIFGNVAPGKAQSDALAFVGQLDKQMPPGYHLALGGASVAFKESMGGLMFALLLGIAVAYMVLASQFNSFLHPITVLTILPLSVAGAIFALKVGHKSINIFSMIGILLLMGIVKKNSIILVDYATILRRHGLSAREAMRQAGPIRLRPILMTTVSTMMAAVPAALALGAGSETRQPMALAVIGGLVVSTALSLLVVPAFYVMADGIVAWVRALFGRRPAEVAASAERPTPEP